MPTLEDAKMVPGAKPGTIIQIGEEDLDGIELLEVLGTALLKDLHIHQAMLAVVLFIQVISIPAVILVQLELQTRPKFVSTDGQGIMAGMTILTITPPLTLSLVTTMKQEHKEHRASLLMQQTSISSL